MLDWTYKKHQEVNGELSLEEFTDLVWRDNVSEKIVSNAYYAENENFISGFTFDYYRLFQQSDNLTIRIIARMIESFFFYLFRFKGGNTDIQNMEDEG